MPVKAEYVLLGLGIAGLAGLAYWYFFVRKPPVPPEGYELAVEVVSA